MLRRVARTLLAAVEDGGNADSLLGFLQQCIEINIC